MNSVQISHNDIRVLILAAVLAWQLWSGKVGFGRYGERVDFDSGDSPFVYWLVVVAELGLIIFAVAQGVPPDKPGLLH